jgi:hypothetical protein
MTRIPYAEQPAVRAEFCTCEKDGEGEIVRECIETRDELGRLTSRTWHRQTDPDCKLHGNNAQPAPF